MTFPGSGRRPLPEPVRAHLSLPVLRPLIESRHQRHRRSVSRLVLLHDLDQPTAPALRRPPPASPRFPLSRRPVVLTVLLVALGWTAVTTFLLLALANETDRGAARLSAARSALVAGDLAGATGELVGAARAFSFAHDRARSPVLAPLRVLPIVGRQLTSVGDLSGAAADVAGITAHASGAAEEAIRVGKGPDGNRVRMLRLLAEETSAADRSLDGVDLRHSEALIGPLDRHWATLERSVADAHGALRTGAAVFDGLADFLAGPRRYLLLAANNAEMRAGSGMFLSAGILESAGGTLRLGPMRPTGDLLLPAPGVPLEGDVAARWGWLGPGQEWRNLGTTPRFDATGPVAARMWEKLTGQPVDGVLAVDVELLRAALAATGPVQVGGMTVDAGMVVEFLLRDQYTGIDAVDPVQADRRDQLGLLAGAVINALEERDYDPIRLAREIATVSSGRHLLAWSSVEPDQATWETAGISGSLTMTDLSVSLLSRGGNKVDQFLRSDVELGITASTSGSELELTVNVRNTTPSGLPGYVVGPHPESGVAAGDYLGIVSVGLPADATDATIDGVANPLVAGPDGPTQVVATGILVPMGQERTVVVRFRLPTQRRAMRIVPSARIPPVRWTAGTEVWTDDRPRTVSWVPA